MRMAKIRFSMLKARRWGQSPWKCHELTKIPSKMPEDQVFPPELNRSASSKRPLQESENGSKVVPTHSSNIDCIVMSKFSLERSIQILFLAPNPRVLRSIVVKLWPKAWGYSKRRLNPAEHQTSTLDDEGYPRASREADSSKALPMLRSYPHDEDLWNYADTARC